MEIEYKGITKQGQVWTQKYLDKIQREDNCPQCGYNKTKAFGMMWRNPFRIVNTWPPMEFKEETITDVELACNLCHAEWLIGIKESK